MLFLSRGNNSAGALATKTELLYNAHKKQGYWPKSDFGIRDQFCSLIDIQVLLCDFKQPGDPFPLGIDLEIDGKKEKDTGSQFERSIPLETISKQGLAEKPIRHVLTDS